MPRSHVPRRQAQKNASCLRWFYVGLVAVSQVTLVCLLFYFTDFGERIGVSSKPQILGNAGETLPQPPGAVAVADGMHHLTRLQQASNLAHSPVLQPCDVEAVLEPSQLQARIQRAAQHNQVLEDKETLTRTLASGEQAFFQVCFAPMPPSVLLELDVGVRTVQGSIDLVVSFTEPAPTRQSADFIPQRRASGSLTLKLFSDLLEWPNAVDAAHEGGALGALFIGVSADGPGRNVFDLAVSSRVHPSHSAPWHQ